MNIKKKIMIAEDNEGIVEALQMMLEDAGYEVMIAMDGTSLLIMEKDLPDLVLLDIWLSGMDGTTICKQLKSNKHTRNMPVIICSANKDTKKLAEKCGADDFVVKPFEMDDLLATIKKHIG